MRDREDCCSWSLTFSTPVIQLISIKQQYCVWICTDEESSSDCFHRERNRWSRSAADAKGNWEFSNTHVGRKQSADKLVDIPKAPNTVSRGQSVLDL